MLPFGPMDPTVSLKVAQDVYAAVPYLNNVFEEKFDQNLLARIADGGYNLRTSFDWNKVSDSRWRRSFELPERGDLVCRVRRAHLAGGSDTLTAGFGITTTASDRPTLSVSTP